jgi:hypothetical protein
MDIGHQHARFTRDQFGAEIIWMATYTERKPTLFERGLHQWAQIGDEPVVPAHQFVKLASG